MSLINDALKRAESEKRASQPSASTPPLQPVESAPSHSTSPLLLGGVFLLGLGAIGIAAALWFGGRTTQVLPAPAPSSAASTPAQEPANVATATTPVPTDPGAQSAPASSIVATTQNASNTVPPSPVVVASSPQTSAPKPLAATAHPPAPIKTAPTPPATTTPPATRTAQTQTQTNSIRLQSIFYRLRNPTVIINGKTLGVGDTLDGIKVVSIQRTSVEIVQNGKYRTLTLQD
jgi:cytoskeletal protein RodZ